MASQPVSALFPAATGSASTSNPPPELEEKFAGISSHVTVLGYMVLSRSPPVSLIRHSGVIFEGEQGRKYAGSIAKMVAAVQGCVEDVSADNSDKDGVRFMRIRTKRYELMIAPDDRYILVVLHDPPS